MKINYEETNKDYNKEIVESIMTQEEYEKELIADPYKDEYADTSYKSYINSLIDAGIISDETYNQ